MDYFDFDEFEEGLDVDMYRRRALRETSAKPKKTTAEFDNWETARKARAREEGLRQVGVIDSYYGEKYKNRRRIFLAPDCYQARPYIGDQDTSLWANLDDQQRGNEDAPVSPDLYELAQSSLTCVILDPEEYLIQMEERYELEEMLEQQETAKTPFYADSHYSEEQPDGPAEHDETHFGLVQKTPKIKYQKSRQFGPAARAALLAA